MQEFKLNTEQQQLISQIRELTKSDETDETIVSEALKEFKQKMFSTALIGKETGILCFRCKKRSGTDCAGRKSDESTLCKPCLLVQDKKNDYEDAQHFLKCLDEGMFDEEKFYEFMEHLN